MPFVMASTVETGSLFGGRVLPFSRVAYQDKSPGLQSRNVRSQSKETRFSGRELGKANGVLTILDSSGARTLNGRTFSGATRNAAASAALVRRNIGLPQSPPSPG